MLLAALGHSVLLNEKMRSMQSELKMYHSPFSKSQPAFNLSQAARIKIINILMVLKHSLELLKYLGSHSLTSPSPYYLGLFTTKHFMHKS